MAYLNRSFIDQAPLSRFQITAIAICCVINMLDGFDVMLMAFTATHVASEWELSGTQLGTLLSAGVFGMTAGCLILAPLADHFGRRLIILFGLVLITAGMLLSSLTRSTWELGACRIVTGLGIGTLMASVTVITSEYASARWRSTAIGILAASFSVGATIGGSISTWLIEWGGWRFVFLSAGVVSVVMFVIVVRHLPESLDFLLAKKPRNALARVNSLLRRMGHPSLMELMPATDATHEPSSVMKTSTWLKGSTLRTTIYLWLAFFCVMATYYFVASWTPKLLGTIGLSTSEAIVSGAIFNFGCMVGALLFSWLVTIAPAPRLIVTFMVLAAVCTTLIGIVGGHYGSALVTTFASGICIFGAVTGLYALAPTLYMPTRRTTGLGTAIGIGRIGGIVAPFIAGLLIDAGWRVNMLYALWLIPLIAATLCVHLMRRIAPGAEATAAGVRAEPT